MSTTTPLGSAISRLRCPVEQIARWFHHRGADLLGRAVHGVDVIDHEGEDGATRPASG